MSSQIDYQFSLQATTWDSVIRTQMDSKQCVPLSANVISDVDYQIDPGTIAQALPVPASPFGILVVGVWGGPISLQLGSNTATPIPVQNLFVLDAPAALTAVFVSNPGTAPINVRAIMAQR